MCEKNNFEPFPEDGKSNTTYVIIRKKINTFTFRCIPLKNNEILYLFLKN